MPIELIEAENQSLKGGLTEQGGGGPAPASRRAGKRPVVVGAPGKQGLSQGLQGIFGFSRPFAWRGPGRDDGRLGGGDASAIEEIVDFGIECRKIACQTVFDAIEQGELLLDAAGACRGKHGLEPLVDPFRADRVVGGRQIRASEQVDEAQVDFPQAAAGGFEQLGAQIVETDAEFQIVFPDQRDARCSQAVGFLGKAAASAGGDHFVEIGAGTVLDGVDGAAGNDAAVQQQGAQVLQEQRPTVAEDFEGIGSP